MLNIVVIRWIKVFFVYIVGKFWFDVVKRFVVGNYKGVVYVKFGFCSFVNV